MSGPVLLFISSSDYDALQAKGVTGMIAERSEGGYFGRVVSIHPFARKSRTIEITHDHILVEIGFDCFPGGARFRPLRILYAPFYLIRSSLIIAKIISKEKVDIVRASDPYWAALVGYLGNIFSKAKFVISIHADWEKRHQLDKENGAPKLFRSRKAAELLARFLIKQAQLILCIRKSLFSFAINAGARPESIRLFPHGIDLKEFLSENKKAKISIPIKEKIIFFAGRLSKENYIDDVIDLGRRLANRKDLSLLIAGGGLEEERIRNILDREPELKETVCLLGFISRDDVIKLRRNATVNFVPMGGFSLIEACASARPTVAYDVEWHSELIEHGKSGLLVVERDIEGLVNAIEYLLDNIEVANRMGCEGKINAIKKHSLEEVYKKRSAVYGELLNRKIQ